MRRTEPTMTRRAALGLATRGAVAAAGAGALARASAAAAQSPGSAAPVLSRGRTKVVVLGSHGGQQESQLTGANLRCGTSVLIDVAGELLVVDCGVGSLHRLVEAGYDANQVRHVLVTHHHQDHTADLGNFAGFGWASGRNGGDPNRRMDLYGPTGTRAYERGYKQLAALSIADQEGPLGQVPRFRAFARWHEFRPPKRSRRVLSTPRFTVHAIRVTHGGMPSVGYRVRTPDLDLVFSGDRGYGHDRFASFAKGADAMFHEIIDRELVVRTLQAQGAAKGFIRHLVEDHCSPEEAGRAATAAGVETLVLYHLIPANPGITDDAWRAMVQPHFGGRIVVSRDLEVV
jgi:ribonuclease BN (tRNA processing enzyme)